MESIHFFACQEKSDKSSWKEAIKDAAAHTMVHYSLPTIFN